MGLRHLRGSQSPQRTAEAGAGAQPRYWGPRLGGQPRCSAPRPRPGLDGVFQLAALCSMRWRNVGAFVLEKADTPSRQPVLKTLRGSV